MPACPQASNVDWNAKDTAEQARLKDEYIKGWTGATFSYTHTAWPRRDKGKERAEKPKEAAFVPGETLLSTPPVHVPPV